MPGSKPWRPSAETIPFGRRCEFVNLYAGCRPITLTSNQPDDSRDKGKPMLDAATATSLQRQPQHSWHSLDFPAIYASIGASDQGLSEHEASVRLRQYGPNTLPEQGVAPLWLIVLRQFVNPLIYILVIAAVVSVLIGEAKDAAFIAAVLVINAVIGTYQECAPRRACTP